MPESKSRKKATGVSKAAQEPKTARLGNPVWLGPTIVGLLVFGLIWIVVAYLLSFAGPIPGVGSWNLVAGFAFIIAGLMMSTRLR